MRALLPFLICAAVTNAAVPTTQPTLYVVGTAHLDTQWLWTIQDSIREYVPATLNDNFARFEKFPDYVFSFEGAFRYMLAKEYNPKAYEKLKKYIADGRWRVAGSSIDAGDVNIPSPEALIRQILYGNGFFEREFGKTSCDIYLPDCFGFGFALPSVAAHCGLKGFSTQKLTWGSSVGIPFDIGVWQGVDGSQIVAALNPGDYVSHITEDLSHSADWLKRIDKLGEKSGAYDGYRYFGVGDQGGAPDADSVAMLEKSIHGKGPVHVRSTSSDQLYRDLTPDQIAKLPRYTGELLMTRHGTGCYTSQAIMKRWNRRNEQLADAAERAAVVADWLGMATYPREKLTEAWTRLLWHHHHDDLTGTSIPQAYTFSWNDEAICLNQFASVLTNSVAAVARALDTESKITGIPLVIFNPLSIEREDVVEAVIKFPTEAPAAIRVIGPDGHEAPSQILDRSGNELRILILAKVPSIGFGVFDVQSQSQSVATMSPIQVTDSQLDNDRYRVKLDANGDIASILDKAINKELLAAPIRLQLLTDAPDQWPEWEVSYKNVMAKPRGFVGKLATIRITEKGPVRAAIEVVREADGSTFVQRIRLAAGKAGDRVEIDNRVDWHTPRTLVKTAFDLTASNPKATYDLGLGTIERGNNHEQLYEVPAQQWADLTDKSGDFGTAIINDCKYGWDKPNDHALRLTLIHSPLNIEKEMVPHRFLYAVAGHKGDWRNGQIPWIAARVNQPLMAFQTTKHPGPGGKSSPLASVSTPQVAILAFKMSEGGREIIIRLQELHGRPAETVRVTPGGDAVTIREVTGAEKPLATTVENAKDDFVTSFKPYQSRTFALKSDPRNRMNSEMPRSSIPLPFNADIVTPESNLTDGQFDAAGHSIPAELLPSEIIAEGIAFKLGQTADKKNNAVACKGQTIDLPTGDYDMLYLLAAADGRVTAPFEIDGARHELTIGNITGDVAQWASLVHDGQILDASRMSDPFLHRDPIAWVATHRHSPKGIDPYIFCYLYRYGLPLPKSAKQLKLPDDPRIKIMAITLANDPLAQTTPASDLYDRVLVPTIEPRQELTMDPLTVTITTGEPGAEIHFTTDGAEPDRNSPRYTKPLTITKDTTVKARAYTGAAPSDLIAERRYRFTQPRQSETPANLKPGLQVAVYEGQFKSTDDLIKAKPARTLTHPDFTKPANTRENNFALTYSGYIEIPKTGIWTFYTKSDDGSRLWIGDKLVVENDGLHGASERSGAIALAKGKHPIKVAYFQRGGDAELTVSCDGPETAKTAIPAPMLFRKEN